MLWTTRPNISIITNFGCNNNCWYCIWKTHPLKNVHIPTDWKKVQEFIKGYDKVSISGGGDPLYNLSQNQEWWSTLFSLGIKIDVHTREKTRDITFLKKVNRLVFSSDSLTPDKEYLSWAKKYVPIRITHIALPKSSITEYVDYCVENNMQFSIKKLSGYDDKGVFEVFQYNFPQLFFIEDNDYNTYFMPDNTVWNTFKGK